MTGTRATEGTDERTVATTTGSGDVASRTGTTVLVLASLGVALVGVTCLFLPTLTLEAKGVIAFVVLLGLLFLRIPVGIALAVTGLLGLLAIRGPSAAANTMQQLPWSASASWSLSVIPMFILMGMLLDRSGAATGIFGGVRAAFGRLPGGLAISTNLAGSGLSAASGSTLGIAYMLGRVALPEMARSGYDRRLSAASVLMAGTGGQLIPPSILLVVYAGLAQVPVGQQLAAGIAPGIVLAVTYALMMWIIAVARPGLAPRDTTDHGGLGARLRAISGIWPVVLLLTIIVGGLYSGVFTATQAGAFGVVGAFVVVLLTAGPRQLARSLTPAARDTASATGAIFLVIIGGAIFAQFMALSGVPAGVALWLDGLDMSPVPFLLVVVVMYLGLGTFMDPMPMMLITVPILLPVVSSMGIDPLVFGVLVVLLGELAVLTPPVGVLVFAVVRIAGSAGVRLSMREAFSGAMWFYPAPLAVAFLIIVIPSLALWLPGRIG